MRFASHSNQVTWLLFISLLLFQITVFPVYSRDLSQPQENSALYSKDMVDASIQQPADVQPVLRMGGRRASENTSLSLDPLNLFMIFPNSLIYEPLIEYDDEYDGFIPVLAYQWVVSNDSKHWTFYLRDDVLFHDGSRFNATAVKFSYERYQTIDEDSPYFSYLYINPVESVEIINEFQVEFHFHQPYAPFLSYDVQMTGIISPNSFNGSELVNPIGTGPYAINLQQSNSSFFFFDRFNSYHEGLAPFEQVHYKIYPYSLPPQPAEFEYDILSNNLDFIGLHAYVGPEDFDYWDDKTLMDTYPFITFGYFNQNRSELANVNVRKAINYAIDNAYYSSVTYEEARPLRTFIPRGIIGYDPEIKGYPYDLKTANSLLDQERYFRDQNGFRFSLNIVVNPLICDRGVRVINESLSQLGINCTIINDLSMTNLTERGEFDIAVRLTPVFDPAITNLHLSSNGSHNYGGYSNQLIDFFTELGQQTPVRQEREYYYGQVQKIAQEDCPFLLLIERYHAYHKSRSTSPYFHLNPNLRFHFNYTQNPTTNSRSRLSQQQVELPKLLKDVEVQKESLYFPVTDTIITNEHDEPLNVTVQMSHYLESFIPNQQEQGKFILLETTSKGEFYKFRLYYDLDEIAGIHRDDLVLFGYNNSDNTWNELDIFSSNSSLRFIEVQVSGEYNLFRLGRRVSEMSYFFVPMFLLIILGVVGVSFYTLITNFKLVEKIKEELDS
ncbi:MAG: ABC transporter substrate-binding protein [Candidatus Odinarchaeota archaeon]